MRDNFAACGSEGKQTRKKTPTYKYKPEELGRMQQSRNQYMAEKMQGSIYTHTHTHT